MKRFEGLSLYKHYWLSVLLLLAFLLVFSLYWRNRTILSQFAQEHIKRNNLISKEDIEEPLFEGLRPQIINLKGEKYTLYLPDMFNVSLVSDIFVYPQLISADNQGNLFLTDSKAGKLWLMPKDELNRPLEVDDNLSGLYGLAIRDDKVYVTTDTKLIRYTGLDSNGQYQARDILVDNLPKAKSKHPHSLAIDQDRLYVSVAAPCEACQPGDARRGSILSFNLDGKDEQLFAKGLKYIGNMLIDQGSLWATDLGRNGIAEALPRVEFNKIEEGKDYGWPYCYSFDSVDPRYPARTDFCKTKAEPPRFELPQGHGVSSFAIIPEEFHPELAKKYIFTYAGDKENSIPKGFKVVVKDTKTPAKNLITGWLDENGEIWGSPVGVTFDQNGDMFITDEIKGVVYRISRQK